MPRAKLSHEATRAFSSAFDRIFGITRPSPEEYETIKLRRRYFSQVNDPSLRPKPRSGPKRRRDRRRPSKPR